MSVEERSYEVDRSLKLGRLCEFCIKSCRGRSLLECGAFEVVEPDAMLTRVL